MDLDEIRTTKLPVQLEAVLNTARIKASQETPGTDLEGDQQETVEEKIQSLEKFVDRNQDYFTTTAIEKVENALEKAETEEEKKEVVQHGYATLYNNLKQRIEKQSEDDIFS